MYHTYIVYCIIYDVYVYCILYTIQYVGRGNPFFPKTHRNLDLEMGKNGEKVYEKIGKQTFYFQNRKKIPFFPMMRRNLDLGMEKMGKKVYGKRGKKYSV